jgi:CubicO group peptidase (beta-lactamase class C family)
MRLSWRPDLFVRCLSLVIFSSLSLPSFAGESLRPEKLSAIDAAISRAIADQSCPGGVIWFEHGEKSYHKAYGKRALVPAAEPMTEDTIFDLASLTKVVACTPAIVLLVESGKVELDTPVQTYLNEFTGKGREIITVRQLLTHTSGLRPDIETKSNWQGREAAFLKACEEKPQSTPGSVFRYSDINFLLLGEIVQRVSKTPLEEFVARELFQRLKMFDTAYLPATNEFHRIAPTEVVNGKPWRGVVHDPTARHMGGVAGHAGLFSTASDLARYARMLINLGELEGTRIFKPETVKLMTSVQTPDAVSARRGLGWDIDSNYSGPARGTFSPRFIRSHRLDRDFDLD